MRSELQELWRFRELLWSLVEREIRIRYKNSLLGFFWSLVNPLVTVAVMTLVFKVFLGFPVTSYVLYLLAAYLPFTFFQYAVLDSAQSVLASLPMVKKIYFPREILPLAQIIANFIHLLLAFVVFALICIAVWIWHGFEAFAIQATVIYLPLLLLIQFILVAGIGLIVSALNTFYEDVKFLVNAGMQILFYLSPVLYFTENVQKGLLDWGQWGGLAYTLYNLNPMAVLCTAYRKILLAPTPIPGNPPIQPLPMDWGMLAVTATGSLLLFVAGYALFNRLKWGFVERP